jgi:hypothetical protein
VEAERTLDDLSVANEQLRVDVEKWKEAKDEEMVKLMTTFSNNHISYHNKVFGACEICGGGASMHGPCRGGASMHVGSVVL